MAWVLILRGNRGSSTDPQIFWQAVFGRFGGNIFSSQVMLQDETRSLFLSQTFLRQLFLSASADSPSDTSFNWWVGEPVVSREPASAGLLDRVSTMTRSGRMFPQADGVPEQRELLFQLYNKSPCPWCRSKGRCLKTGREARLKPAFLESGGPDCPPVETGA